MHTGCYGPALWKDLYLTHNLASYKRASWHQVRSRIINGQGRCLRTKLKFHFSLWHDTRNVFLAVATATTVRPARPLRASHASRPCVPTPHAAAVAAPFATTTVTAAVS